MTPLHIEVGDAVRTVTVDREGDRFRVTIDGRTHLVDARRLDDRALSLLLAGNGDNAADDVAVRSVHAAVVPGREPSTFEVFIDGRSVPLRVRHGGAARGRDGGAAASGPQRVTAPMPGKVVRVLVKSGDEVQPRQGLVVIEAMKMENELKAARAGRVREVTVVEGQSVDAGAALVLVE